ncbi:MAG: hypothetical protein ACXIU7_14510 [Roseinatronobacter sp.]
MVILGSAPGAQFPDGDAIYCANSAAVAHPERVRAFATRASVVGDHIVKRGYDPNPSERHKHAQRFIEVSEAPTEKIYVIRFSRDQDPQYPFERGLEELSARFNGSVELIEAAERRALITRISGLQEPIWNEEIDQFLPPRRPDRQLSIRWRHWRSRLRSRLDRSYESSPVFRVSCGLHCLLIAIDRHGPEADYHLAGIRLGLTANRHEYATGDSWPTSGLPHHLLADRIAFKTLAQRYRITIDTPFT